jgi:hypothetical protein
MIQAPEYAYLLIGAVLAGLTQLLRILTAEKIPLIRITLATAIIAAIAAFSLCGILILFMKFPPIAAMFIGGPFGWLGGELVFASIMRRIENSTKMQGLSQVDHEK